MGRKWQRLGLILGVVIFVLYAAKAENTTYPTANNNLSKLQAWRSAEFCLRNTSDSCGQKYTLSDSGLLNLTHDDEQHFCSNGCAEHTKWVLVCLYEVMKDYRFQNNATIKDISGTINIGCKATQGSPV